MAKRHRLEDLGLLCGKLEEIGKHDLFDLYQGRSKDFLDHISTLSDEKREDLLHEMIYGIRSIEEALSECLLIARGHHED